MHDIIKKKFNFNGKLLLKQSPTIQKCSDFSESYKISDFSKLGS